jgi:hypothetical protein
MWTTARCGMVSLGLVAIPAFAGLALAEDVPSPPERPVAPAIVFFPGTGTAADDTSAKWEGPVLTIYDSQSCDAKIAGECALVTFTCDDREGRGLGITIDAIETAQVVKWLEAEGDGKDGMQIDIKGLAAEGKPAIGEISRNDFGAGWKVTFYAPFGSDPGLAIEGNTLVVEALPRKISLDLTDANRSALEQFTELCARG